MEEKNYLIVCFQGPSYFTLRAWAKVVTYVRVSLKLVIRPGISGLNSNIATHKAQEVVSIWLDVLKYVLR